jgi:P-loop Domain of unknown function (DUF2791)
LRSEEECGTFSPRVPPPPTVSGTFADDSLVRALADGISGSLGGKTGIAPRIFLKKLVADLLDRIELHESFDPRRDYRLTIGEGELSTEERNSMAAKSIEAISLNL